MSLDLYLDPVTGDLPDFNRHVVGAELTAQRISVRLQTHVGDWKLERTAGVPWLEILTTKPVDLPALATALAVEVRATPGVGAVTDLSWEQDGRQVEVSMTAIADTGEAIAVAVQPQGIDGNPSIMAALLERVGAIAPR